MVFVILMSLFNSWAHQLDVINVARLEFGGISLGVMESLLMVGAVVALFRGATYANNYPNERTPLSMLVMLTLLILGGVCGLIGSYLNDVPLALMLRSSREYFAWPVCIYLGFRLLPNPQWGRKFAYVVIVAGLIAATMILLHWTENAELAGRRNTFAFVRTVWYVPSYAGLAALVVIYSMAAGREMRLMPWFLAVLVTIYCLLGFWA